FDSFIAACALRVLHSFPTRRSSDLTTRREGTTGRIYDLEGYYTADIYASSFKSNKWSKARSINYPNSYGNESVAGISEDRIINRSEEHTSELQSRENLVCRLLLEKK